MFGFKGEFSNSAQYKNAPPGGFRQSLFWDVDPSTIDPDKHARYIIERVLDFGNDSEARWLYQTYEHPLIADVVEHSRVIKPESRALWKELIKA